MSEIEQTAQVVQQGAQAAQAATSGFVTGFKEILETVTPYMEKAAEAVGTSAKYLFQLQVQQAKVYAISACLKYVLWFLLFGGLWRLIQISFREGTLLAKIREDISAIDFFMILLIINLTFIATFIFALPSFVEVCTLIFNPEYWALSEVVKLLKGNMKF
jgi:hypothetical protein